MDEEDRAWTAPQPMNWAAYQAGPGAGRGRGSWGEGGGRLGTARQRRPIAAGYGRRRQACNKVFNETLSLFADCRNTICIYDVMGDQIDLRVASMTCHVSASGPCHLLWLPSSDWKIIKHGLQLMNTVGHTRSVFQCSSPQKLSNVVNSIVLQVSTDTALWICSCQQFRVRHLLEGSEL